MGYKRRHSLDLRDDLIRSMGRLIVLYDQEPSTDYVIGWLQLVTDYKAYVTAVKKEQYEVTQSAYN